MEFTCATNVRSRRQSFDLPGGHARVGGVEIHGREKVLSSPFDKGV